MKSLADDKKKITSIKRRSLPVCHCRAPSQNEIAKLFFSGHKREPKHHDTLFLSPLRHFQSTRFVVSERFRKLSNSAQSLRGCRHCYGQHIYIEIPSYIPWQSRFDKNLTGGLTGDLTVTCDWFDDKVSCPIQYNSCHNRSLRLVMQNCL